VKGAPLAFVVAAPHSGAGKTTVACALIAALRKHGHRVQPFKAGPDFLDTGYHAAAAGRPSINLDLWLMSPQAIRDAFASRAQDADVCVLEGMMGLFDGSSVGGTDVSTAAIAAHVGAPVVLVVDGAAIGESAAAIVHGFASFGRAPVAGVIFNRLAGPRHYDMLRRAVETSPSKVRVLGWLPADASLEIPERRLGLVGVDAPRVGELLPRLVAHVEKTVDLDALLTVSHPVATDAVPRAKPKKKRAKIAVARDAAFHFYYEDNLEALRAEGADVLFFSPLTDKSLPKGAGGLYLGGGFPENHAPRLEANRTMRASILKAVKAGMPTYAECGGLMYLATNFIGSGVRAWEMVGAIPGEVRMEGTLQNFGYVTAAAEAGSFLVSQGETVRGQEYHFSSWTGEGGAGSIWKVARPGRDEKRAEGYREGLLHASYVHLHFGSSPKAASRLVTAAEQYGRKPRRKRS